MIKWSLAQFLEKKWWTYYLSSKNPDEYLDKKKKYWVKVLQTIEVMVSPEDTVIDLGCGPAGIFTIFDGKNSAVGVDPLMGYYQKEFKNLFNQYHHTQFIQSPLETFIPTSESQLVFCLNAINHVQDIDACMMQVKVSGTSNALYIISSDLHRHHWAKKLLQWLPFDMLHPKQMDKRDFEYLIKRHGFAIIRKYTLDSKFLFDYDVYVLRRQ